MRPTLLLMALAPLALSCCQKKAPDKASTAGSSTAAPSWQPQASAETAPSAAPSAALAASASAAIQASVSAWSGFSDRGAPNATRGIARTGS